MPNTSGAPPLLIDCGANIGTCSHWFTRRFPDARVVAFEPDPIVCAVLRKNVEALDAVDITVVEAAAWLFDGQAALDADNLSGSRLAQVAGESADDEEGDLFVPTVDLRRFLDEPTTLLKVDIEGGESTLLRHCALELATHVSYVHVEIHELRPSPRTLISVLTTLEQAGFEYHVSPLHVDPQPFRSRLSYREIVNPLAVYAWKPTLRPEESPVDTAAASRSSEM